jgi:hypothetical protein
VGLTDAGKEIQIDRWSSISDKGAAIDLLDSANTFKGWKTIFNSPSSWIQYNSVDFGARKFRSVAVRAKSTTGGTLQIRADGLNGVLLAEVKIPKGGDWSVVTASISKVKPGVHHLAVVMKDGGVVAADWIRFE